jgi:hypothetical protein
MAAAARAFLVAVVIAMPVLLLPGVNPDSAQIVALMALAAAVLIFVEYLAEYPSLIEFRSAPPLNRLRFLSLFVTMLLLTLMARSALTGEPPGQSLQGFGAQVGAALDFPFSPVRLMVLAAPPDMPPAALDLLRAQAGLAYLVSVVSIVVSVVLMRLLDWPLRHGAFNFFVNLPLFDPTTGGDVLRRLKRDSHVNLALGFLMPFLIPAVLMALAYGGLPPNLTDPQPLIWTMIAWAFLPASLILRGVALMRIASLIEEKRRRAYAQADWQPV